MFFRHLTNLPQMEQKAAVKIRVWDRKLASQLKDFIEACDISNNFLKDVGLAWVEIKTFGPA